MAASVTALVLGGATATRAFSGDTRLANLIAMVVLGMFGTVGYAGLTWALGGPRPSELAVSLRGRYR